MRRAAALLFLPLVLAVLFLPGGCRSHRQQGFPGSVYITRDYEFRVDRPYPGYRFWVVSDNRLQPLHLSPQRSDWAFGAMRQCESGWVVAAPPGRVEEVVRETGVNGLWSALLDGTPPPGLLWSQRLDFGEGVSFTDSRDQIVTVCELQICLPDRVRLERVRETEPSKLVGPAWLIAVYSALAGVALTAALAFDVYVRLLRGEPPPPGRGRSLERVSTERAVPVAPPAEPTPADGSSYQGADAPRSP